MDSKEIVKKPVAKNKVLSFFGKHKKLIIFIIILAGGGFWYYKSTIKPVVPPSYVLGAVTRGVISTSVSGSGQISSSNQIDIKPKISADIVSIKVKAGDTVKAGQVLAVLDSADLARKVRTAANSLATAQANLDLKFAGLSKEDRAVAENTLAGSKMSYENSIKSLETTKQTIKINLDKAQLTVTNAERTYADAVASDGVSNNTDTASLENSYVNARATINSANTSMRSALVAADSAMNLGYYSYSSKNYSIALGVRDSQTLINAKDSFMKTKTIWENFDKKYKEVSINWTKEDEEALIDEALDVAGIAKQMMADTYKMTINSVPMSDITQADLDSFKSSASSNESSLASAISSLQTAKQNIYNAKQSFAAAAISGPSAINNAKNSLENAKNSLIQAKMDAENSLTSAENDIASKKLAYESAQAQFDLKIAPPRDVDIASLRLQVADAHNNLLSANEDLANATIKSPIDGKIAKVYQKNGDVASSATAIITVITEKSLANISLNEVDATKVKVGQKVLVTLSAIDGLSITGEVAEIDSIGTVTQNVVSYNVQIAFDVQDERVKPQMSISATVITNEKTDALLVPNSAVQTDNFGASYVLIPASGQKATDGSAITLVNTPTSKNVEIGLVNDTYTEIASGLNEGDIVVYSSINNTATTAASSAQRSGLNMLGGGGGGMRSGAAH